MKAFVINLERSTTRRAFMKQQLDKQGIEFEFIKAVDGATLTDEYLAEVCNFEELEKRPHIMRKGMYGCILSHYEIYQRIVAENLPYALVLEDDIVVQPKFKDTLNDLESKVQLNEAILLFSQNNFMPTVFSKQHAEKLVNNHLLAYPMEPWALGSTAGYIISKAAAQGMLEYMLPLHIGPDAWIAFYRDKAIGCLRCVTPFLVKPAGFTSDIDYIISDNLLGRALTFVKKYRIFPFKQLLDYRRKRALDKSAQFSFTSDASPVALARQAQNH